MDRGHQNQPVVTFDEEEYPTLQQAVSRTGANRVSSSVPLGRSFASLFRAPSQDASASNGQQQKAGADGDNQACSEGAQTQPQQECETGNPENDAAQSTRRDSTSASTLNQQGGEPHTPVAQEITTTSASSPAESTQDVNSAEPFVFGRRPVPYPRMRRPNHPGGPFPSGDLSAYIAAQQQTYEHRAMMSVAASPTQQGLFTGSIYSAPSAYQSSVGFTNMQNGVQSTVGGTGSTSPYYMQGSPAMEQRYQTPSPICTHDTTHRIMEADTPHVTNHLTRLQQYIGSQQQQQYLLRSTGVYKNYGSNDGQAGGVESRQQQETNLQNMDVQHQNAPYPQEIRSHPGTEPSLGYQQSVHQPYPVPCMREVSSFNQPMQYMAPQEHEQQVCRAVSPVPSFASGGDRAYLGHYSGSPSGNVGSGFICQGGQASSGISGSHEQPQMASSSVSPTATGGEQTYYGQYPGSAGNLAQSPNHLGCASPAAATASHQMQTAPSLVSPVPSGIAGGGQNFYPQYPEAAGIMGSNIGGPSIDSGAGQQPQMASSTTAAMTGGNTIFCDQQYPGSLRGIGSHVPQQMGQMPPSLSRTSHQLQVASSPASPVSSHILGGDMVYCDQQYPGSMEGLESSFPQGMQQMPRAHQQLYMASNSVSSGHSPILRDAVYCDQQYPGSMGGLGSRIPPGQMSPQSANNQLQASNLHHVGSNCYSPQNCPSAYYSLGSNSWPSLQSSMQRSGHVSSPRNSEPADMANNRETSRLDPSSPEVHQSMVSYPTVGSGHQVEHGIVCNQQTPATSQVQSEFGASSSIPEAVTPPLSAPSYQRIPSYSSSSYQDEARTLFSNEGQHNVGSQWQEPVYPPQGTGHEYTPAEHYYWASNAEPTADPNGPRVTPPCHETPLPATPGVQQRYYCSRLPEWGRSELGEEQRPSDVPNNYWQSGSASAYEGYQPSGYSYHPAYTKGHVRLPDSPHPCCRPPTTSGVPSTPPGFEDQQFTETEVPGSGTQQETPITPEESDPIPNLERQASDATFGFRVSEEPFLPDEPSVHQHSVYTDNYSERPPPAASFLMHLLRQQESTARSGSQRSIHRETTWLLEQTQPGQEGTRVQYDCTMEGAEEFRPELQEGILRSFAETCSHLGIRHAQVSVSTDIHEEMHPCHEGSPEDSDQPCCFYSPGRQRKRSDPWASQSGQRLMKRLKQQQEAMVYKKFQGFNHSMLDQFGEAMSGISTEDLSTPESQPAAGTNEVPVQPAPRSSPSCREADDELLLTPFQRRLRELQRREPEIRREREARIREALMENGIEIEFPPEPPVEIVPEPTIPDVPEPELCQADERTPGTPLRTGEIMPNHPRNAQTVEHASSLETHQALETAGVVTLDPPNEDAPAEVPDLQQELAYTTPQPTQPPARERLQQQGTPQPAEQATTPITISTEIFRAEVPQVDLPPTMFEKPIQLMEPSPAADLDDKFGTDAFLRKLNSSPEDLTTEDTNDTFWDEVALEMQELKTESLTSRKKEEKFLEKQRKESAGSEQNGVPNEKIRKKLLSVLDAIRKTALFKDAEKYYNENKEKIDKIYKSSSEENQHSKKKCKSNVAEAKGPTKDAKKCGALKAGDSKTDFPPLPRPAGYFQEEAAAVPQGATPAQPQGRKKRGNTCKNQQQESEDQQKRAKERDQMKSELIAVKALCKHPIDKPSHLLDDAFTATRANAMGVLQDLHRFSRSHRKEVKEATAKTDAEMIATKADKNSTRREVGQLLASGRQKYADDLKLDEEKVALEFELDMIQIQLRVQIEERTDDSGPIRIWYFPHANVMPLSFEIMPNSPHDGIEALWNAIKSDLEEVRANNNQEAHQSEEVAPPLESASSSHTLETLEQQGWGPPTHWTNPGLVRREKFLAYVEKRRNHWKKFPFAAKWLGEDSTDEENGTTVETPDEPVSNDQGGADKPAGDSVGQGGPEMSGDQEERAPQPASDLNSTGADQSDGDMKTPASIDQPADDLRTPAVVDKSTDDLEKLTEDSEKPVDVTHSAGDLKIPVADQKLPATDQKLPATDQKLPVDNQKQPTSTGLPETAVINNPAGNLQNTSGCQNAPDLSKPADSEQTAVNKKPTGGRKRKNKKHAGSNKKSGGPGKPDGQH